MSVIEIASGVFLGLAAMRGLDVLLAWRERRDEEAKKRELMEPISGFMDMLTKDIEHDRRMNKALEQAHQEVSGDRIAKVSEYSKIEARFHEITGDHYLKMTKSANGKPDVTISDKPFTAKPATKKAPVKKPVAKAAPTKKTVTKKGK